MSKNKKTFYVTTPIYYASGTVHIGNSYTTIAADTMARFNRLIGNETLFLTGMDEHGQKIEEAAKKAGRKPKPFVDDLALEIKNIWNNLDISNDIFIRTSDSEHIQGVQKIFEKLLEKKDIYLDKYSGDYCVACESFFTKTQIIEEGICPDCGKKTIKLEEETYFLNLKKYSNKLLKYINDNPDFIQPETRKNEVISFIEQGLENLSVSRTSFNWGVPVLSNPKHVVYVWIDALSNYITALGYGSINKSQFNKYWVQGDEVVHIVGKDILRFHAIYWPIMLMALNIPIKFKLYVHGWVLMKEGKMSKSTGNLVYPLDVTKRYGIDALRYYLLRELPLGNDCYFSYERFIEKYNADLANDLGNLVSRTVSMANKYLNGEVLKTESNLIYSKDLKKLANEVVKDYDNSIKNFRIQDSLISLWTLISKTNKYVDETEPWKLAKEEKNKELIKEVIYHLIESIRVISILLSSILPSTSLKIQDVLNLKNDDIKYQNIYFGFLSSTIIKVKAIVLFKRLDKDEELEYQTNKKQGIETMKVKEEITIDDFNKLDFRIGKIIKCEKAENADKLLILQVDINGNIKQIVSSIADNYETEELVGKKIVVLVNLKATKFRGYLSEGMLLAASNKDGQLEVLEVNKLDNDAVVD
jgi:methionyl-tRNA synthetase